MSTTIPAARAALFTVLSGLFSSTAVVRYGANSAGADTELVRILDTSGPESWASLGAGRKEENYDTTISLAVWTGSDTDADQVTVEDRVFAMLDLFQAEIRRPAGDDTLGGVVRQVAVTDKTLTTTTETLSYKGRYAELVLTVNCQARI